MTSDGVPEAIHEADTVKTQINLVPYVSPYGQDLRCKCGAVCDEVDPADIRVIYSRRAKGLVIVRCPSCPRS